jgi:hypothetical protein
MKGSSAFNTRNWDTVFFIAHLISYADEKIMIETLAVYLTSLFLLLSGQMKLRLLSDCTGRFYEVFFISLMERNPWGTNSRSVGISRLVWNPKIHCRIWNSPPLVPALSQINPVHSHNRSFQRTLPSPRPCATFRNYGLPGFLLRFAGCPVSRVAQSVYWLATDWATGILSPAEAEDFSSTLCVQTGPGAHPASCTLGTGGSFPGAKRGRGVMLTTDPLLVPRSKECGSYISSLSKRLHSV